jgi:hypothetical protein
LIASNFIPFNSRVSAVAARRSQAIAPHCQKLDDGGHDDEGAHKEYYQNDNDEGEHDEDNS